MSTTRSISRPEHLQPDAGKTEHLRHHCFHRQQRRKQRRLGECRAGDPAIAGWFESDHDPNTKLNHWGREIFPQCAYNTLMERKRRYGDIPIYVTENGHGCYDFADENGYVEDDERIEFLRNYLHYILKAKQDGVNLKGYYVWSTMDLYSWINGYKKRYGLVRVDYDDPQRKRTPKKSYFWYKQFIAEHQDL